MLEIGAVVDAVVERIEPYGAWLKHNGDTILVLIVHLAWVPPRHPSTVVLVGETVPVKILQFSPKDKAYSGSVRAARPELNPYAALASLPAGAHLPATLWIPYDDGGGSVVLPNGAVGHVLDLAVAGRPRPGDTLEVVIQDLNVDEGSVKLRAVPKQP
jgi:hypothetical protein